MSGTTLTDTTATEDGTSANVTTETWGADKLLVFNGTSSELTFVNEIYPEVDFSISLWMAHPNSIVEHEIIVVVMGPDNTAPSNQNSFRINPAGNLDYFTETGSGVNHIQDLGVAVPISSTPTHYVYVVTNGKISVYVDSVLTVNKLSITNVDEQTYGTFMGKNNWVVPYKYWLNAKLGKMKFYTGELTQSEVDALYAEV